VGTASGNVAVNAANNPVNLPLAQNARALCWMIARTAPSERRHHRIAQLDQRGFGSFREGAKAGPISASE
jgi:hypothetical protein